MKLAVDAHNLLTDHRGIGRYARAVLRRLVQEPSLRLVLLVHSQLPWSTKRRRLAELLGASTFSLATRVPRDADVVWHPWNGTFFESNRPSVVTIHDVVPFAFPANDPARRSHEQEPFLRSARAATLVIAVSFAAVEELVAHLAIPHERIRPIYHGVEASFSPADAQRERKYLLFVGDPGEARKNFTMLHEAYRQAWPAGDGPALVCVGGISPSHDGAHFIAPIIEDAHTRQADVRMRELYCSALALCVPSRYESFGMPVVEAMACGTPVLCSTAGSLPEIAGDAAFFLDPQDRDSWASALRAIAHDRDFRRRLRERGLARAAAFSWERCTSETLAVLREAAKSAGVVTAVDSAMPLKHASASAARS